MQQQQQQWVTAHRETGEISELAEALRAGFSLSEEVMALMEKETTAMDPVKSLTLDTSVSSIGFQYQVYAYVKVLSDNSGWERKSLCLQLFPLLEILSGKACANIGTIT